MANVSTTPVTEPPRRLSILEMGVLQRTGCFASSTTPAEPFHDVSKALYHHQTPRTIIEDDADELRPVMKVVSHLSYTASEREAARYHGFPFIHIRRKHEERRRKEEEEQLEAERQAEQEAQDRRESIVEAEDFLEAFVRKDWEGNFLQGHVKIHCDLTMDEVKSLGHLDQAEGSRECRKLISAPVIHDAIGFALWKNLSEQATKEDGDRKSEASRPPLRTPEKRKRAFSTSWSADEGLRSPSSRRSRSATRRATEGDLLTSTRSRSAYAMLPISEHRRRKSDIPMVRADKVLCTTCGSKALGEYRIPDNEGDAASINEDSMSTNNEDNISVSSEETVKRRQRLSRRLSQKVSEKVAAIAAGVAGTYGKRGMM